VKHFEMPAEILEAAELDQLRSTPGFEAFRSLIDRLAGEALLAMMRGPVPDMMEWRGRALAYFHILEEVNARVHAGRELAARLRREDEEARERERLGLEQEIERREREAQSSFAG
jgi:hypothetical protein